MCVCTRYGYRRNFRFYDTPNAFLTLFEVLTLEGWLDVRDLFGNSGDVFKNEEAAWVRMYVRMYVLMKVAVRVCVCVCVCVRVTLNPPFSLIH